MRIELSLIMAILLLATLISHGQSTVTDANDRSYIQQAEYDWARSIVTNDVSVIERNCADDFVGVDIDGSRYSKADTAKNFRSEPSDFLSIHLNAMEIRLYGNAAVAQGSESWQKKDGTAGKFVWTDTWIRREGRWQIVAAQDVIAADDLAPSAVPTDSP